MEWSRFQFSQSNLQDFVDCPRRFELRYIQKTIWPALQSEPVLEQERLLEQGHRFHELVHQYLLGIPVEVLQLRLLDLDLRVWWENFMQANPLSGLPEIRYPEFSLSAPFAGSRLVAKYDLLVIDPGHKIVILDWKTSQTKPSIAYLAKRIQSRLYPFLLVEAGTNLNHGKPIQPDQIEMIFWFATCPEEPWRFKYTTQRYQSDREELHRIISEIIKLPEGRFMLTNHEKRCEYCVYRSLCNRGIQAGDWLTQEDEVGDENIPLNVNFDQVAEIEF